MAKMLNDLGYRTRSGANFSDMAIDRLLRDTTAKGFRDEVGIQVKVDPIVSDGYMGAGQPVLGVREGKAAGQYIWLAGRAALAAGL